MKPLSDGVELPRGVISDLGPSQRPGFFEHELSRSQVPEFPFKKFTVRRGFGIERIAGVVAVPQDFADHLDDLTAFLHE